MKFTLSREQFLTPIQNVNGAIERRHNLPILSNILIEVRQQTLFMTGTDIEVELIGHSALQAPSVEGSITVPAKKLFDIIRALPEGAQVTFEVQQHKAIVKSGRSRFTLATLASEGYPNLESWQTDVEIPIKNQTLKSLIDATQLAMAHQDSRHYLNGLLIETEGHQIRAIATDGHRLAYAHEEIPQDLPKKQLIIPRKSIMELLKLIDQQDEVLNLSFCDTYFRAASQSTTLTCKLIEGRFPDYNRVLPKGGDKIATVKRQELRQALQRASILSNEKFRGVRLGMQDQTLTISANNPEQEEAEETLDMHYNQAQQLEIGFNVSYLLDVMNTLPSDEVKMTFIDTHSSVLIEDGKATHAMYVIMPMRL